MNIGKDNDDKKIQQATVDNNLTLRTLDQLRDLISFFLVNFYFFYKQEVIQLKFWS